VTLWTTVSGFFLPHDDVEYAVTR